MTDYRRFSLDHLPVQDAANAHGPVDTGYATLGGNDPRCVNTGYATMNGSGGFGIGMNPMFARPYVPGRIAGYGVGAGSYEAAYQTAQQNASTAAQECQRMLALVTTRGLSNRAWESNSVKAAINALVPFSKVKDTNIQRLANTHISVLNRIHGLLMSNSVGSVQNAVNELQRFARAPLSAW